MFSNLFKKSDKPSAAVFVDYEHWYYGYNNIFSMKPNVQEWYDELTEEYNVKKLMFFGDFNGSAIEKELPKLEKILTKGSNTIELHVELYAREHLKSLIDYIRAQGGKINLVDYNSSYANSGLSVYTINMVSWGKNPSLIIKDILNLDYVNFVEILL